MEVSLQPATISISDEIFRPREEFQNGVGSDLQLRSPR